MEFVLTKATVTVFRQRGYLILALFVATTLLLLAIWLPNLSFLWYLLTEPKFSWATKLSILGGSYSILKLNSTLGSRSILFALVALSGVNISMLVYYLKRRLILTRAMGTSALGTLLGLIGVGCASCGSVVLASIFGLGTTTSFLAIMPLRGLEFGLISIILLVYSIVIISKKISDPLVCNY